MNNTELSTLKILDKNLDEANEALKKAIVAVYKNDIKTVLKYLEVVSNKINLEDPLPVIANLHFGMKVNVQYENSFYTGIVMEEAWQKDTIKVLLFAGPNSFREVVEVLKVNLTLFKG